MKKLLLAVGILVLLIIVPPVGFIMFYSYDSQRLFENINPQKPELGSIVFREDTGFLDTSVAIFVRDTPLSGSRPINLGLVDNGGQGGLPEKTVWSKDGMMLAVWEYGKWTYFYDFQEHNQFTGFDDSKKDLRSRFIQQLLNQHGGEGKRVPSQNEMPSRHPWPWENY